MGWRKTLPLPPPQEDDTGLTESAPPPEQQVKKPVKKRKYFVPDTARIDAGVFHVGFAAGGNFYTEPVVDSTGAPTGDYFKDFGFQGGAYFDYDYGDIPLGLRGFIGYKYILSSVNVFDAEGIVRYMINVSENAKFGIGGGVSAAIWYRAITTTSLYEEIVFLPSLVINLGFDFNPFMIDFRWLVNRFGVNSTITGFELSFGFRL